jgi:hypothetical protein
MLKHRSAVRAMTIVRHLPRAAATPFNSSSSGSLYRFTQGNILLCVSPPLLSRLVAAASLARLACCSSLYFNCSHSPQPTQPLHPPVVEPTGGGGAPWLREFTGLRGDKAGILGVSAQVCGRDLAPLGHTMVRLAGAAPPCLFPVLLALQCGVLAFPRCSAAAPVAGDGECSHVLALFILEKFSGLCSICAIGSPRPFRFSEAFDGFFPPLLTNFKCWFESRF